MNGSCQRPVRILAGLLLCSLLLCGCGTASADVASESALLRVLLLRDYNTQVVVFGATLLGTAAGFVGCFTLLHRAH